MSGIGRSAAGKDSIVPRALGGMFLPRAVYNIIQNTNSNSLIQGKRVTVY